MGIGARIGERKEMQQRWVDEVEVRLLSFCLHALLFGGLGPQQFRCCGSLTVRDAREGREVGGYVRLEDQDNI